MSQTKEKGLEVSSICRSLVGTAGEKGLDRS
ncbi:hypothetical protein Q426_06825 [Streptococcus equi subsp. zooepidemicus CY]|nr:hypothetical protein Q426_06825 [Streptococcus equi subsp. zooepidemicus CY]